MPHAPLSPSSDTDEQPLTVEQSPLAKLLQNKGQQGAANAASLEALALAYTTLPRSVQRSLIDEPATALSFVWERTEAEVREQIDDMLASAVADVQEFKAGEEELNKTAQQMKGHHIDGTSCWHTSFCWLLALLGVRLLFLLVLVRRR